MLQAGVTDPSTYPCKGDTNRIPLKNRIKSKKKKKKKPDKFQMFIALIELVINMIITVITTCFPFMRFSGLVHLSELVIFSTTSGC